MGASDVLLDTNVLLNATAPARELHEPALRVLNDWPNDGITICTSGEVLREYLAVATRGLEVNGLGLSLSDALGNRDKIEARMKFLDETHAVATRLRQLVDLVACSGRQGARCQRGRDRAGPRGGTNPHREYRRLHAI